MDASGRAPYHAVSEVARRLSNAGFRAFREQEAWQIEAGARGFVVRAGGSIVAFQVGTKAPADAGFVLLGAHTDSPNLRLKPLPDLTSVGYRQLSVEIYGGVLLSTWLDRDLSVAGRVVLADGKTELIDLQRAVCRVPNLAIHLNREVKTAGLQLNAQTQLVPVLGLEANAGGFAELLREGLQSTSSQGARVEDVLGFDLCLYDTQRSVLAALKASSCSLAGSTTCRRATRRSRRCSARRPIRRRRGSSRCTTTKRWAARALLARVPCSCPICWGAWRRAVRPKIRTRFRGLFPAHYWSRLTWRTQCTRITPTSTTNSIARCSVRVR